MCYTQNKRRKETNVYKRILAAIFAVLCTLFSCVSCDDVSNEPEASVADADAAYIASIIKLSDADARELYERLLEAGMREGIKYITKWTSADGTLFYRLRTSKDVFELYPSGDGTFELVRVKSDETETDTSAETELPLPRTGDIDIIINVKSMKYHHPDCRSVSAMKEENKLFISVADIDELEALGYSPCGICCGTEAETSTSKSE